MWDVIYRPLFLDWFDSQSDEVKERIYGSIGMLRQMGPNLARPYVDTIKGSKVKNLKELRVKHIRQTIRIFFAFDPVRRAILLCAGDKTGNKRFYDEMIPIAEREFELHQQLCCKEDE